jgi:hypothetical protein
MIKTGCNICKWAAGLLASIRFYSRVWHRARSLKCDATSPECNRFIWSGRHRGGYSIYTKAFDVPIPTGPRAFGTPSSRAASNSSNNSRANPADIQALQHQIKANRSLAFSFTSSGINTNYALKQDMLLCVFKSLGCEVVCFRLSDDLDGVLCLETEAAGLMNSFPCLWSVEFVTMPTPIRMRCGILNWQSGFQLLWELLNQQCLSQLNIKILSKLW